MFTLEFKNFCFDKCLSIVSYCNNLWRSNKDMEDQKLQPIADKY